MKLKPELALNLKQLFTEISGASVELTFIISMNATLENAIKYYTIEYLHEVEATVLYERVSQSVSVDGGNVLMNSYNESLV